MTISTTHVPATDLGYLLHKNPSRAQSVELSYERAHVFYPEASHERCTVALAADDDPVGLVRGRRGPDGDGRLLAQYVNDRPYVATSFLSVAIAEASGTALADRSKDRPELAATSLLYTAHIAVVPCRGGETFLRRLFEPLGYVVSAPANARDDARVGAQPLLHGHAVGNQTALRDNTRVSRSSGEWRNRRLIVASGEMQPRRGLRDWTVGSWSLLKPSLSHLRGRHRWR